ncbi:MAG: hypothetical protein ABSE72_13040 [Bacteroidales bacterium]|jgi:hypothetical protein
MNYLFDTNILVYFIRINPFLIIPIEAKDIVDVYAEIDAFSKGKLPDKPLPVGLSTSRIKKS